MATISDIFDDDCDDSELQEREMNALRRKHETDGYREGISGAKEDEALLQHGFDRGFGRGFQLGDSIGVWVGCLSILKLRLDEESDATLLQECNSLIIELRSLLPASMFVEPSPRLEEELKQVHGKCRAFLTKVPLRLIENSETFLSSLESTPLTSNRIENKEFP